ncbi:hypothetical protein GCM10027610_071630 [Dactylosporangium cerinum]
MLVATGFALVGNLATSTVQVAWRWWPLLVWAAAGVLVTVSVLLEWRRHRAAQPEPGTRRLLAPSRVFGRIPLHAGHFQDRVVEVGALERALGGNGQAALVALPGSRGRVRPSWRPRTRVAAMRRVLIWWRGSTRSPVR